MAKFEVTRDDMRMSCFEYGLNDGPDATLCCPVAQALNRLVPGKEWHVDPSFTRGIWQDGEDGADLVMPEAVRVFANWWDENWDDPNEWPESFSFDLPIEVGKGRP